MRRTPLRPSRGTVIPFAIRQRVLHRDRYRCIGSLLGWASHQHEAFGHVEIDHVRASHGVGMKSETVASNLVLLCVHCHDWKTRHGREARPQLIAYLAQFEVSA